LLPFEDLARNTSVFSGASTLQARRLSWMVMAAITICSFFGAHLSHVVPIANQDISDEAAWTISESHLDDLPACVVNTSECFITSYLARVVQNIIMACGGDRLQIHFRPFVDALDP